MARVLADIAREIMTQNSTRDGWLKLEEEVVCAMACATESEIQAFVESGAGEILDMSCSAIRIIQKQ